MEQIGKATNTYGVDKFGEIGTPTVRNGILVFVAAVIFMGMYQSPNPPGRSGLQT